MDYDTLAIDTSIFDKYGLQFNSGLLRTLAQFKISPSDLVLPDIVIKELRSHLINKINEARSKVEKAIKLAGHYLFFDEDKLVEIRKILLDDKSVDKLADQIIGDFIDNAGITIIDSNLYVELDELTWRYFNNAPPFSGTGKKKSEFPDAIALLAVEKWAKQNNKKVIAVSTDQDWHRFAEQSPYIDITDELGEAIALFQPQNEAYAFCLNLSRNILRSKITNRLEEFLSNKIPDIDIYPEAISSYYYDADWVELTYNNFEYNEDDNGIVYLKLVKVDKNKIVIELSITVYCTAYCNFTFLKKDWIDKDYVKIGSNNVEKEFSFTTGILLTLVGHFSEDPDSDSYEIDEIEILEVPSHIDFGEVEPDWGYEDH